MEDQAELVASRQVQRELRGEVAEASTELAVERAAHAANRQIQRELRSTSAELSLELSSRRAFQLALRNATRATSGKIGKRNRRSALRNVASMPGEALPLWGAAVIVGVTALEVYDLCQTMIDMTELQKLFDPNSRFRFDLHGFTLLDANQKVQELIIHCQKKGFREILLITGKGLHSNTDKDTYVSKELSKLKFAVPEYINSQKELSDKIFSIEQASIKDGGEGAIIIKLKKL